MITARIKFRADCAKTRGIAEASIPTGKIIFQSEARVANKTNKKPEKKKSSEIKIKSVKVVREKEKIKSYEARRGLI